MALLTVFEAVKAKLAAAVPGPLTHDIGQQHVGEIGDQDEKIKGPRIVWVPTVGPINGGRQAARPNVDDPPMLFQRKLGVEAYIFAGDVDKTEALLEAFIDAVHAIMPGSWNPVGETWIPWSPVHESVHAADWVRSRPQQTLIKILCVFRFTLDMAVSRVPYKHLDGVEEEDTEVILSG